MRKRRLLQFVLFAAFGYLLFCAIAGVIVAEAILHPSRHRLSSVETAQVPVWAKDDDAVLSDITIAARDGVSLSAWELDAENGNGDVVVLLHGLRGNRVEMVNYADILLSHGYSVLMPDARAHGESGGTMATYGLLEREDIHLWVQWLVTNRHPRCIYGLGESMGAAQLLQALESEPRFCAVAAECPFSTLRETSYDRMGQRFHAGPWLGRTIFRPLVASAYVYARLRYGLNMELVAPERAVAKTQVPVLLIHGKSDTNIPVRHSRRIAATNRNVVIWELPNTGHSNAIDTSPQELEDHLVKWFEAHQQPPGTHLEARILDTY